jgi:hypothetical protein
MWRECAAEVAEDAARILRQLAPSDPDHPPAGGDGEPVALTIVLECRLRAVERIAVELDDQSHLVPDSVGLNDECAEVNRAVERRRREPGVVEHRPKPRLQLAARYPAPTRCGREHRTDRAGPRAARIPVH